MCLIFTLIDCFSPNYCFPISLWHSHNILQLSNGEKVLSFPSREIQFLVVGEGHGQEVSIHPQIDPKDDEEENPSPELEEDTHARRNHDPKEEAKHDSEGVEDEVGEHEGGLLAEDAHEEEDIPGKADDVPDVD